MTFDHFIPESPVPIPVSCVCEMSGAGDSGSWVLEECPVTGNAEGAAPPKKRKGCPPGSKNKKSTAAHEAAVQESGASAPLSAVKAKEGAGINLNLKVLSQLA